MIRRILSVGFAALCTLGLMTQASSAQVTLTSINTVVGNSFVATATGSFIDSYGNIYVANSNGTTVVEIPANGGAPITLGTGFVSIRGIVADSHGNVYIAQSNNSTIAKIPAGGGTPVQIGAAIGRPFMIAVDAADTIYITDTNNARIDKILYGQTTMTTIPVAVPTGYAVRGVALDANGLIYVSLSNSGTLTTTTNQIVRLNADGTGQVNVNITGIATLQGIALDPQGNLYVLDGNDGKLLEYKAPLVDAPGVNTPITLATGTGASPVSVTVSPRGDIVYNSTKVMAIQTNVANFYSSPVLTASGAATLTFTSVGAKGFSAPVFTSEGSSVSLFKDAGAETTGCVAGKSVAAGGVCTLNVSFTPQQVGLANGTVTIMDNSTTPVALVTVPLTGVGSAPLASYAPGTQSSFVSGMTQPAGLASDLAGNVYSVDMGAAKVAKISSAGVSAPLAFAGLQRPVGVAVDGALSVYVSDANNNAVYKLTAAGVQTTVATTGLSAPKGISLDGFNNLYIADSGNARVVKVDATGVQTVLPMTGLVAPSWVATDNAGNVYVADTGKVYEYTIAGAQKTLTTTGLGTPTGLAVGADSTLYAADSAKQNVYALLSSGTSFTLGSAVASPTGLVVSASGNVYVASSTGGTIALVDRTKQTLTFPSTASGTTSAPMTAVVQNTGNAPLTYTALAVSAGFAQVTPTTATDCTGSSTVNAGGTCTVNVVFAPTSLGPALGTVTQTDNVLNVTTSTQTISLVGTGIRATTTTLATTTPATGNPVYGATFTVTATVTPTTTGGATPTGTVTFAVDGGAPSSGVSLNGSAQAQYSPVGLAAGAHTIVAVYSGDTGYTTSTSSTFNVTVAQAVLTVTAVSQTRQYGVANATLAATITGYVNGDSSGVVTGTPALATTATTTSDPGSYPLTVAIGTLSAANYTFSLVNGTITVGKATNTILFPALSNVTYGASPITLAATSSSGLPITYSVSSGPATVTNGAGAAVTITGAGPITIAANQAGNTDYAVATQVTQSFVVAPAVLTVTADPQSKQQGQVNPTLTYTIAGFKYADTVANATTGLPALSTTALTSSPVGTYPITAVAGTLAAANYTFTFVGSTLTITGNTPQTITFGALPNVTYGVAPIVLNGSASSNLPITYLVTGPATLSGSTLTITGVGTVTVKATQAGNATYAAATAVTQSFTVNPATLTVTTPNVSRVINTPNPTFLYTITGYVNGEGATVVSGAPAITTTAVTSSPVGQYPIVVAQGSLTAANYVFTTVGAVLTVTAAPQTITFTAIPDQVYGVAPIALTATSDSGLVVTYTVTGPAGLSGSTLVITGVGTVSVTASQAGNATYAAATPVTRTFKVMPAALTVTASDASITFGAAIPTTFAYTIIGFVYSDTQSVVSGKPTITTTATASSPGGTYPITPTLGTLTAANYAFTPFVPGTLTIGQAAQTITFAALQNIPQTTTAVTLSATASSGLAIVYTVTGPATVSGNVLTITGPGTVAVTATQPGNSSYSAAAPVTQTFNVTGTTSTALTVSTSVTTPGLSVTLTATVTGHITGSNPTGTVQFFVNGTAFGAAVTCGTPTAGTCKAALATTTLPSGTPTIYAAYSGDNFFSPSNSTTGAEPIQVIAGDFNVSATSTNLTMNAGSSASSTITISPVGAYSDTLKLSCSNLPANMFCTFAPPALNFYPGTGTSSQPQTTTVTITAKAQEMAAVRQRERTGVELAMLFFGVPMAGLMLRRRKKLLRVALLLLLAAGVSVGVTGCGSNITNLAAPGTYNVHVDMIDGTTVSHTLTITVTVQ